ncbi:DUF262 domain-containing protein [Georgenia sp. EYE_87]|uniref:GmrSD restriction endonuclease domain-containing protein n=1 Tax=Georgenia sp. EYE_87 TaxID=2853448 RepID=UPI002005C14B|nr:DUF262 domain-containing protein [Georgenia sp. EYE_87]MCK6211561.1 DUF262 domain-containing protein [Georgenia sp. EYE_87]
MVKAVETSLRELLEGSKQYQVPLYQRTFSWKRANFDRLWDDVSQLVEDRQGNGAGTTHFMGSLVLAPTPSVGPAGVSRYLVVDGQQRLTTLTLLLAAIRDHRAETESAEHRDRLNEQYLINKWREGVDRPKVLPTQADRASYRACVEGGHDEGWADGVGEAYRYFRGRLADHDDPDDDHDIARMEEAVLSGLTLVSVTTSHDDNVHRIFESLNNTGLRLTQGDLLRNYLFMRLPTRGDVVYETQWMPLQERLTNEQLELLFWLDVVQTDETVNQRDTYQAQVARMDRLLTEEEIEAEVARFNRLSGLVERILNPAKEQDPQVRERLTRLSSWGTTTVYPLLLHLLDRRERGLASSEEIASAMLYAESYLVRRVLIGRATANLNRILLRAVPEIAGAGPADQALRTFLSTGRKFFATDDQVRAAVKSTAFYYSGRASQRKLLLTWIEQTFANNEPVDPEKCTIEHVMPQTITSAWRQMLRPDVAPDESLGEVYDSLVHTLGNLTLTGYNSALGNKPFSGKREAYRKSGFKMNQEIANQQVWSRPQILARADRLAERIVAYWPGPDPTAVQEPMTEAWGLMNRALAELPAGTWTSYSAVAQLIGSHQVPVGQRIANHPVPNGHRVLQAAGTTSPGFRWLDGDERTETQREALEAEGVSFDEAGRADPAQRVDADELAVLAGVELLGEELLSQPDDGTGRSESFLTQLAENHSESTVHGVIAVMDTWVGLGGRLQYGEFAETTCFLILDTPAGVTWPAAIYPKGKFEVVFQYLKDRPPFDELGNRRELAKRLNAVEGVELPEGKLAMRPGFTLDVLGTTNLRQRVIEALEWFVATQRETEQPEVNVPV